MSLVRIIELRDAVDKLCARLDAGEYIDERLLADIAVVVHRDAGILAHDLLVKLASRSKHGRAALKEIAH